ncbi:Hypothetical_protein [Hexamita inflata]|uniref:Hypothetical_protein n=1 Tax=Hexamita inflata TaxID=28002 RepID=A0AA86TGT7_9EUKA|nr:Hypothetical protein HINF_LOCUS5789 [Hexamita inflata]
MNAAYYGRPLVAAIFVKLSQQKEFQEFIFKQLLTRDEQKLTCIEICQSEIDYVKYGTSLAYKKQVIQQYRKLMRRAFTWAESKGYKVDDFLKKNQQKKLQKVEKIWMIINNNLLLLKQQSQDLASHVLVQLALQQNQPLSDQQVQLYIFQLFFVFLQTYCFQIYLTHLTFVYSSSVFCTGNSSPRE